LNAELEAYVRNLVGAMNPIAVILYGSRARGDSKPSSDFDVIVIAESLPRFMDRWDLLYRHRTNIPLEPRGFTPEEFLKMIEECNPTALDALYEGKVLLDRGFIQTAKAKFEEVSRRYKLRKKEGGWMALNPAGL
jgi:hypothetical protein